MMKSKMKQLALAVGVALGGMSLLPSAEAVSVSADNLGQALIFPYYTVRNDWNTLLGVVNTSNYVVAVKVRFHEALNSRDVMDFNIFLSPHDEWTGWVTNDVAKGPVLYSEDVSCTAGITALPQAFPTPVSYVGTSYSDGGPGATGGSEAVDRMREGYVEMIMMGAFDPADAVGQNPIPAPMALALGAIHSPATGVPTGCAALKSAFGGIVGNTVDPAGALALIQAAFPDYPVSPLKGTFALVNGPLGFNAVGLPTALSNFRSAPYVTLQKAPSGTSIPFQYSWHQPTLASATTPGAYLDSADVVATPLTPTTNLGAASVTGALEAASVVNEWSNRTNAAAGWVTATDWVITFPTKHFYVDNNPTNEYAGLAQGRIDLATEVVAATPTAPPAPFASYFVNTTASGTVVKNGKSCDGYTPAVYNREEALVQLDSPSPGPGYTLCWESNVLTFNKGLILGSPNAVSVNYPSTYTFGWMNVTFDSATGLPAIGFEITSRDNNAGLFSEAALVDHSIVRPVPAGGTGG